MTGGCGWWWPREGELWVVGTIGDHLGVATTLLESTFKQGDVLPV